MSPPPPLSLHKPKSPGHNPLRPLRTALRTSILHLKKYAGVGIVCSVAYFDPGNWSVDLQAGSEFGYKLLFVVLLAGLMAALLQAMATKLGVVTGLDLATHCRLLLYNRTSHPRLTRWLVLYPLYAACEIAIISTDLAELLGSATAINLLIPSIPLWAGVLLTTVDVLFVLALGNPGRKKPVRVFEVLIAALVLAVFVCLLIVIVKVSPKWGDAFDGFLPSHTVVRPGALYISVGIIGATVMPHGLFLGSALATQDRISFRDALQGAAGFEGSPNHNGANVNENSNTDNNDNSNMDDLEDLEQVLDEKKLAQKKGLSSKSDIDVNSVSLPRLAPGVNVTTTTPREDTEKSTTTTSHPPRRTLSILTQAIRNAFKVQKIQSRIRNNDDDDDDLPDPDPNAGHDAWENNTHAFVSAHLKHGVVDVVLSLLGFAVAINAMILILAAAVFFPASSTSPTIMAVFNDISSMMSSSSSSSSSSPASLPDAYHLISSVVGKGAAVVFALALLCAGQSASITATVAGQVVCEGFIRVKISPVLRRLLTRLLSLLPSMIVAIVVGPKGIDTLLVLSQVILSIVLPFAAFPLVYLTSSKRIMRVRKGRGVGGGSSSIGVGAGEEKTGAKGVDEDEEMSSATMSAATASTATAVGTGPEMEQDDILQRAQCHAFSVIGSSSSPSTSQPQSISHSHSQSLPNTPLPHTPNTPNTSSTLQVFSSNPLKPHINSTNHDLESKRAPEDEWVDYSNHWITTLLGYAIWLLICIANVYVIGTLGNQ